MGKSVMDIEKIYIVIQKLNMYKNEESIKFSEINSNFNNLCGCIKSSNVDSLQNIQFELINKFNVIKKIHENDVIVLNKNISKYIDISSMTNQMFSNIYKG